MSFLTYFKQGAKIVMLDRNAMKEMAKDKKAATYGLITLIIAGLLTVALRYKEPGYAGMLMVSPIFFIICMAAITFVIQVFVRLFHGPVRHRQLFKVLSLGSIMCWLWILVTIPVLGIILKLAVLLWGVVMSIVAVEVVYNMKAKKAIPIVLIPFIIAVAVMWIVGIMIIRMYVPI
ncbi:MAG: YIP1 family protein [Candidatus Nanoarchaeia archaeon]